MKCSNEEQVDLQVPRCEGIHSFNEGGGLVADRLSPLRVAKLAAMERGEDVIDLSMFNPDIAPPRFLLDKLMEASGKTHHHRYAVSRGIRKLREAFAEKWYRRFNVILNPETEICATLGSKDAVLHALLAIAKPGQKVLCVSPVYPAYRAAIALARLQIVTATLGQNEAETLASIREVADKESPKVFLLNFPHNPSGAVVTANFWRMLGAYVRSNGMLERGVCVINDFVYGELSHDGQPAASLLAADGAAQWGVEAYSLSKAYSVPGWRVGALAGNAEVVSAVSQLKSNVDYGIFLPVQMAAAAALEAHNDLTGANVREYRMRASVLGTGLKRAGFIFNEPRAGGSIWAKAPEGALARAGSTKELAAYVLTQTGVLAAPGWFYDGDAGNYLRFSLVAPIERLREVGARLERLLSQ